MLFFKMILHGFITELNNCFASLSELVLHGENIFKCIPLLFTYWKEELFHNFDIFLNDFAWFYNCELNFNCFASHSELTMMKIFLSLWKENNIACDTGR